MRHVFIVNPVSGKADASGTLVPQIIDAAKKLGISRNSYESKKKTGKFTTFEIKTLCRMFKCKFDYLFQTDEKEVV